MVEEMYGGVMEGLCCRDDLGAVWAGRDGAVSEVRRWCGTVAVARMATWVGEEWGCGGLGGHLDKRRGSDGEVDVGADVDGVCGWGREGEMREERGSELGRVCALSICGSWGSCGDGWLLCLSGRGRDGVVEVVCSVDEETGG